MKKILLPLILLILGVGSGIGAGLFLIPQEPPVHDELAENTCNDSNTETHGTDVIKPAADEHDIAILNEYAKLSNQFVIPIIDDGLVSALVVLSLSIEVPPGNKEAVFLAEPKLRDSFLQAMFDHANVGGFSGNFTSAQNLRPLREDLARRAAAIIPSVAKDILITDILRQDV